MNVALWAEIRRLADMTAVSTLDIERMVKEMQYSVSAGVMEMDKFSEQVRKVVGVDQRAAHVRHRMAGDGPEPGFDRVHRLDASREALATDFPGDQARVLQHDIAGLIHPTSGSVEIFGMPVVEPRDEIGIVFQRPTLLPWFDVLGNVTFPMRHKYGFVSDVERTRARELLELVGLGGFATRRPEELSGGMQQRVAIARALLLDPDILLMDEPFSALDALTRDEMSFELLRIWTERPKTVLFITHSIPEALLLADRIIVMTGRPGRVREVLDVPLARPRSMKTLSEPVFHELASHIRGRLFSRPVAA